MQRVRSKAGSLASGMQHHVSGFMVFLFTFGIGVSVMIALNLAGELLSADTTALSSVNVPDPNVINADGLVPEDAPEIEPLEPTFGGVPIGCWSSMNGLALEISPAYVSMRARTRVRYVLEKVRNGSVTMRLINRPQFFYLQEFSIFEYVAGEPGPAFVIKTYRTREDLRNGVLSGVSALWVEDNCNELFGRRQN